MNRMSKLTLYIIWTVAALVLAGVLAVGIRYARDIKAARDKLKNIGSQLMDTDCGTIEYVRIGEGYPVLIVHGTFGGFDQGLWIV